ncbi:MAG TPA: NAD-glutamate dehydrogenase [Actinomycetes bacterium]|nr:NAD-glutamate dehydrogenase [Actinomycetes bacterium]
MSRQSELTKAAAIDEVARHLHERLPGQEAALAERFVREYYEGAAPEDVLALSPLDRYGAAVSLWAFAADRQPGEFKVRVYSPRLEDHGWHSTHTVVEIVSDDMPFLVDSVTMELNRHGLTIHLIFHPVMQVRREHGRLVETRSFDAPGDDTWPESVIHVQVDRQTEPEVLTELVGDLERVLADVRAAVDDWRPMREKLGEIVAELEADPPPVDPEERAEAVEFLRWLGDDHFTFIGYREYDLGGEHGDEVRSRRRTGLGVLRHRGARPERTSVSRLNPDAAELARALHILVLTKANSRSTVHRPSYLDYVGVRRFDQDGAVVGEYRFLGLYTSVVYHHSPRGIPLLRQRIRRVLDRAGFPPSSHNEKALLDVLETYPRDELIQTASDELFDIAMGILHLKERQRVRLFVRQDPYGRYLSCLVFVPRDRYDTDARRRIEAVLTQAFDGVVADFSVRLSESVLARVHLIVRPRRRGTELSRQTLEDISEVEARLVRATRSWADDLKAALLEQLDEEGANELFRVYRDAFPAAYREDFPARNAIADILQMQRLASEDEPGMCVYHPLEAPADQIRFKLFWSSRPPLLSELVPLLEDMGLEVVDERPFEIHPLGGPECWIDDFGLVAEGHTTLEVEKVKDIFQEAFARVWHGDAESDGFNRLVLRAGLEWRQVAMLRAYAKYLRQAGITFSSAYMERTVAGNPRIARLLVELFAARFDPAGDRARAEVLTAGIEDALDAVDNLDQDRILRSFLTVIRATVRTNWYRTDAAGRPKPALSFKLDPEGIAQLPKPRPLAEIWVYSPRVEAVHLRAARVARGGIRWSDREEDFRTEVLGLMKAQTVKNAVIVPGGAKGGFVVKHPPEGGDRDALMREVRECYATFMRAMLDLTDSFVASPGPDRPDGRAAQVVPPPDLVRHDGDDPYLVVAADKGTATFSDLANSIAHEYGYWLGDAFASGGSTGYDHKQMGITARGAWESVRRHFREMGVDPQTQAFTVAGIGDMSGDVFGNGMLLSHHIHLVAAFNHQHVFLDPNPDAEAGWAERRRLFELPRSSWSDYDRELISEGGGVYDRAAKSIPISPQVRRALAIDGPAGALTPAELIRRILLAPVDLLFNGGIGTYVKAASEANADVGDRANDAVRVDGSQLRCRVVAEGGNLGLTQRGRIEYALAGGRINTDFIDNSGGVDCSDHEVNLKILLDGVVAAGDLTVKQRNELLAEMTDQIARLVLHDNHRQAQSLSVSESIATQTLDRHERLIRWLERHGRLDRRLEALPDAKALAERRAGRRGLTRPELAVLLAHAKNDLQARLLDSDVPEDPYLSVEVERYLPAPLQERFAERMHQHRLRREIIANNITNSMINRVGPTFVTRLREETGAEAPDVARAYTVAREVYDLRELWTDVEALDDQVQAHVQLAMLLDGRRLAERATNWLLRNRRQPLDVAAEVSAFAPGVSAVAQNLPKLLVGNDRELLDRRIGRLAAQDVPEELAIRVAALGPMLSALDIVEVATRAGRLVEEVAAVYFQLAARLDIDWLRRQITNLAGGGHWDELARAALREDLYVQHRGLAAAVVRQDADRDSPEALVDAWLDANQIPVRRCLATFEDLKASDTVDLAMLSVGLRELRNLVQTGTAVRSG